MKKLIKKFSSLIIVGLVIACTTPFIVSAANSNDTQYIYSFDDLQKLKDDPNGSYVLMCDIDCEGENWEPLVFSGTFDGNNHALLNLATDSVTTETRKVYDSNMIAYNTVFSGFFGILEDATIKNLNVLGFEANVATEKECFIGTIAGFMERSSIENCSIYSDITLSANDKCFGVGGVAGFGNGTIKNSTVETYLTCIDKNKEVKDEQFLGGAYGAGYIDLIENNVTLQGYISDHGYVHSGGLVGMYILYPAVTSYNGFINKNRIVGAIHFFEDNTDRRAYCAECVGEVMNWTYEFNGNTTDFQRDEIFDYSSDILPHYKCSPDSLETTTVSASCSEYGYAKTTCKDCGLSNKYDFVAKSHVVKNWEPLTEATSQTNGVEKGVCSLCNEEVYRATDSLPATGDELDVLDTNGSNNNAVFDKLPIIIIIAAVIATIIIILAVRAHNIKKRKRRRKNRRR